MKTLRADEQRELDALNSTLDSIDRTVPVSAGAAPLTVRFSAAHVLRNGRVSVTLTWLRLALRWAVAAGRIAERRGMPETRP